MTGKATANHKAARQAPLAAWCRSNLCSCLGFAYTDFPDGCYTKPLSNEVKKNEESTQHVRINTASARLPKS